MSVAYATLDEIKAEKKTTSNITSAEELALLNYARVVSKRIDRMVGFEFLPRIETRDFLIAYERVNTRMNTFYFRDPLLSLSGVVVGQVTLGVGSEVTTYPANSAEPARDLRLIYGASMGTWYDFQPVTAGDPPVISITGIWGWRTRYASEGWSHYDDVLDAAGINASTTSVTVADADGADPFGLTPRFSPGQLLRIGTEYLEVTAVNTTNNILTVRRGVLGSTAAAHALNADVDAFQVEEDIKRVTVRQAALLHARKGAFQVQDVSDVGSIQYPADLLAELQNIVGSYYST